MGSTIWNVPADIKTYEQARKIHDQAKPIRGTERRPLGARRDHWKYSVAMTAEGDVQFVLYKTPVITYHHPGPDNANANAITLRTAGWSTVATHEMFWRVLGIAAQGWRGKSKLTLRNQTHVLSGKDDSVRLVRNEEGRLVFGVQQERYGYVMNRKAANKVREAYAPFLDYLRNMLKLREEQFEVRLYGSAHGTMQTRIKLNFTEMAEAIGLEPIGGKGLSTFALKTRFDMVTNDFGTSDTHNRLVRAQRQRMLEMISSDQPEDVKHTNFYKAALAFMIGPRAVHYYKNESGDPELAPYFVTASNAQWYCDRESVLYNVKQALMMAHAEEVLTLTKLDGTKMPNPKYLGWIEEAKDQQEGTGV